MDRDETQCRRTCRDLRPDHPESWCDGCVVPEAEAREQNMSRWRDRARRENLLRWEARFQNAPEIVP